MDSDRNALLEEHYLDFYRYAKSILKDDDDAYDAVQEAISKVLLKNDIKNVLKYTFSAVHNAAISIIRHHTRITTLDGYDVDDYNDIANQERLDTLYSLYKALPDDMRVIVGLYDYDGYTLKEISVRLGLSKTTVQRRITKAHNILKEQMLNEYANSTEIQRL